MYNSTFKPSAKPMKPAKLRKCCMCKTSEVANKFAKLCTNIDCVIAYGNRERDKRIKKEDAKIARSERERTRERKEKLKTRSDYIKEAQIAFNAYIRQRDKDKPCICCGAPLQAEAIGGGFDCGHYRSVGSAPHLRFDERNAHGQTKKCNRYGAGRAVDYRIGLIGRIGLEMVEDLESDNASPKWTIEELIAIKVKYRQKLKVLQAKAS